MAFDREGRVLEQQSLPEPPIVADPRTDFILGSAGDLFVLGITEQPTASLESWRRDLFRFSAETSRWVAHDIRQLSLRTRLVSARHGTVTLWDRLNARLVTMRH